MTKKRTTATTLLLWVALWLCTCAFTTSAQALSFPRESMIQRMERINENGHRTGQHVSFERSALKGIYASPFNAKTNNIEEWLYYSLQGTKLTYQKTSERDYIVIPRQPQPSDEPVDETAKQGTLTGKVLDDIGEPLPGATVKAIGKVTKGTTTGLRGDFSLSLPAGEYTIEVAFIGFDTHQTTGVHIKEGENTPLSIALSTESTQLQEVVVSAKYNQSNTAGALKVQQKMPQLATIISAQQIGMTADKNIGEVLKRVTGVTTTDNKSVAVRGMGERWNDAMLDGVLLPSTESTRKSFNFSLVPSNLIENVTVMKTATPDIPVSFAGGLIAITTKDIPEKNFISFSAGVSYNSLSTGKEQIHRKRGKMDWLGFDDGSRKLPNEYKNIDIYKQSALTPTPEQIEYSKAMAQHERAVYRSKTPLSQNYQFTIGRTYTLNENRGDRLGFIASLTYRNTQQQNSIDFWGRGDVMPLIKNVVDIHRSNANPLYTDSLNYGAYYKYNTTLGGILNAGYQTGNHRISLRNTFTRQLDNNFHRLFTRRSSYFLSLPELEVQDPEIEQFNSPTFMTLMQNRLEGSHLLADRLTLDWHLTHVSIIRHQKGVAKDGFGPRRVEDEVFYGQSVDDSCDKNGAVVYSIRSGGTAWYKNREKDYSWGLSTSIPFDFGTQFRNRLKLGYEGASKHNTFHFFETKLTNIAKWEGNFPVNPGFIPVWNNPTKFGDHNKAEHMGEGGYIWWVATNDQYEGKVTQHDLYLMLDHRITSYLRLIWGIRGEYNKYTEANNPRPKEVGELMELLEEKPWAWMPSVSLTISPANPLNIRLSYGRTVIRPHFSERSQFAIYDPNYGGYIYNRPVSSSTVDAFDARLEWYPSAGETMSAGFFYRYIDNPIERYVQIPSGSARASYPLRNSDYNKNYGFEFEWRRNLSFIADIESLKRIYFYGNATILFGKLGAIRQSYVKNPQTGEMEIQSETIHSNRPGQGQSPYLINLGVSYESPTWGLNIAYNQNGRKLYAIGASIAEDEYENPSKNLDAQLSYKIPQVGLTLKFNASNLLNTPQLIYNSRALDERANVKLFRSGNYEHGKSQLLYLSHSGRSFSCSATWNF